MPDLIRALPQGLFWYPFLLLLLALTARALWKIRPRRSGQDTRSTRRSDHLESLSRLVSRAHTDSAAHQELERRCIGLLLEANDLSGYSVDNCRQFATGSSGTQSARDLVAEHLTEITGRNGVDHPGGVSGPGSDSRLHMILNEVESLAEVPGE